MLGRVVPLQPGGNAPGVRRFELRIQVSRLMGVEVIGHQDDGVDVGILFFGQDAQLLGKVLGCAPCGHLHPAATLQRLNRQEEIADAVAGILIVLPLRLSGCHRQGAVRGVVRCIVQLLAHLIETDHRAFGVIGALVSNPQ